MAREKEVPAQCLHVGRARGKGGITRAELSKGGWECSWRRGEGGPS